MVGKAKGEKTSPGAGGGIDEGRDEEGDGGDEDETDLGRWDYDNQT